MIFKTMFTVPYNIVMTALTGTERTSFTNTAVGAMIVMMATRAGYVRDGEEESGLGGARAVIVDMSWPRISRDRTSTPVLYLFPRSFTAQTVSFCRSSDPLDHSATRGTVALSFCIHQ